MTCGELHTKRIPRRLPNLAVVGGTCGGVLPRCQKGRTPFERLHGKKPTQEFVPFGEEVLARPISSEPLHRMNPRYKFGVWLGVRNNTAECIVVTAEGVFRSREVRWREQQDRWDKEAINDVIGVPWRIVDGKRTVDRPLTQIDPLPPPPVLECKGRESPEQTLKPSGPLQDARVATRSDLESEHKLTLTRAASGSRNVSKQLQKDLSVWNDEERCWTRQSQKKLRETSEEERKSEVQQESWQYRRSRKTS